MTKDELRKRVLEAGDATVTYRSPNSRKQKYNVCTCDFSTPYIKKKPLKVTETDDSVLMFCWDADAYRLMKAENVISIVPLGRTLNNDRGG